MYRESMLAVERISNGFIIEVKGKFKRKKESGDKDSVMMPSHGYTEKEVFAKDAADLGQKIEALIPLIEKDTFDSEEAFDSAFEEKAK